LAIENFLVLCLDNATGWTLMSAIDKWIRGFSKKDQPFVAETTSELFDLFNELQQQGHLLPTLESKQRKDFTKVLKTSNGLFEVYNMLFSISDVKGKFVAGRNREFVEHNKDYGFTEKKFVNLILSESLSVFLRNIELFRTCFLFVLITGKTFSPTMGVGQLVNCLEKTCGKKGAKIKRKIEYKLRNGLAHGLFWLEGLKIHYPTDITFNKIDEIALDKLWIKARKQSIITQCLIAVIPEWYAGSS
jgi:hypothetical protein